MLEMNKVMMIGNLTRDPELSYIASGTALAKLGLAVNRRWKDRNSSEMKEETAFVDVDVWAGTAEFCGKYLKKGSRVYVEGRLKFDRWQAQDGTNRNKLSVTAEKVQFAEPARSSSGSTGGGGAGYSAPAPQQAPAPAQDSFPSSPPATQPSDETADDLPF